jgi:hypothetical protein
LGGDEKDSLLKVLLTLEWQRKKQGRDDPAFGLWQLNIVPKKSVSSFPLQTEQPVLVWSSARTR